MRRGADQGYGECVAVDIAVVGEQAGRGTDGERRVLVGAVAVIDCDRGVVGRARCVEKDGNVVGANIGDGEVQLAVPVQVGNGDRARVGAPGRELDLVEATAVLALQKRNRGAGAGAGISTKVGDGEVQSAVPVQVANGD